MQIEWSFEAEKRPPSKRLPAEEGSSLRFLLYFTHFRSQAGLPARLIEEQASVRFTRIPEIREAREGRVR